jgi:glycosyltransferase involved in cell wall biosynthesis
MERRNQPCPCGSGLKYKHCCGRLTTPTESAQAEATSLAVLMHSALGQQRAGQLDEAEHLYRKALEVDPQEPNCLHMLGVICYQTGRPVEAFQFIRQALDLTDWAIEEMRHNLGLVLPLLVDVLPETGDMEDKSTQYWASLDPKPQTDVGQPLVSVVIPVYNHADYVAQAIRSVLGQTHQNLELVIIDDGSRDDSAIRAREAIQETALPCRFIARANKGAPATLNEAIGLTRGEYITVLNSDDRFPPDRIERMLNGVAARGREWGFGDIRCIDHASQPVEIASDDRCANIAAALDGMRRHETIGFALLGFNVAVSTGNLFFSRRLFDIVGGFADYTYNHDWDFCLKALWHDEPAYVPDCPYDYRLHPANTIAGAGDQGRHEGHALLADYLAKAFSDQTAPNQYAPCRTHWGIRTLIAATGRAGLGRLLGKRWADMLGAALASQPEDDGPEPAKETAPGPDLRQRLPLPAIYRQAQDGMGMETLISILLPTYNSDPRWLKACIDSVRNQIYPHWELCIADDASSQPETLALLDTYLALDSRIRLARRSVNGHISEATNTALALARGSHCALLDHDDELSPDALFWIALVIHRHSDVGLIYSDEDKIDKLGTRSSDYFKPDWNPELLRAQNCISHLGVYRTDLLRAIGGFRKGLEGAQDWDVALRISERLEARQIVHVPRTLYHWRVIEGSTAMTTGQKSYVTEAQRRCLADHHARLRRQTQMIQRGDFWLHRYVQDSPQAVTLLMDLRNDSPGQALERIQRLLSVTDYPALAIRAAVQEDPNGYPIAPGASDGRVILQPMPLHPQRAEVLNQLAALCQTPLLAVLDPGLMPARSDWLDILAGHAAQADTGMTCGRVALADGTLWFCGLILGVEDGVGHPYRGLPAGTRGQSGRAELAQNFTALGAGHWVMKRQDFEWVKGLDAEHFPHGGDDIDLSLKLHAQGRHNVWTPVATLVQASPEVTDLSKDVVRQLRFKWPECFARDPAYHPKLPKKGALFNFGAAP